MSDEATRTFKRFVKDRAFWKKETADALRPLYRELINAGHEPLEAIELVEHAVSAIASEYGD